MPIELLIRLCLFVFVFVFSLHIVLYISKITHSSWPAFLGGLKAGLEVKLSCQADVSRTAFTY